jgi:hypothetical protein
MKNWEYFELIATYYRTYFALIEQGVNTIEANNRVIDDFYFFPENENVLSNLISLIQNINIQVSLFKKVYKSSANTFLSQLQLVNNELLSQELNNKEVEHLKESIKELKAKLKTIELY